MKLNGVRLPVQVEDYVKEVVVEQDLNAPGSCLIVFADPERNILDTIGAGFLQSLEISASAVEETEESAIFVGDVYSLEFEADESGAFATVRGYDAAYKLKQGRGITSFNDVTDFEVVNQLAKDADVPVGNVEGDRVVDPYLAQMNQSHWDFLQQRVNANDCVLHVRDGLLQFEKSTDAANARLNRVTMPAPIRSS